MWITIYLLEKYTHLDKSNDLKKYYPHIHSPNSNNKLIFNTIYYYYYVCE